jgi:hypothetical protein
MVPQFGTISQVASATPSFREPISAPATMSLHGQGADAGGRPDFANGDHAAAIDGDAASGHAATAARGYAVTPASGHAATPANGLVASGCHAATELPATELLATDPA